MFRSRKFLSVLTIFTLGGVLLGGEPSIERHESAGVVDLVPLADRGTITLPLHTGTIVPTGQTVYFVISDVSDKDFAEMFGAIRADSLEEAPADSVEQATFDNGNWLFYNDAGLVTHFDSQTGDVNPPAGNPDYSPLKRFTWNGKQITANLPFIRWGDGPGQQILVDEGGCSELIRKIPPSPFYVGGGPFDGADCSVENPLDRYKGGQAVSIDLANMTVTMKLHKAIFSHNKFPYYTVFDASKAPPAGFMGVPHVPKLANLGRFGENDAAGRISQFSNGVRSLAGGPNRFQFGITSYAGGQSQTYSPMWHISWVFFDCDQDGVFFIDEFNVGQGGQPGPGKPGFDPADPETFDPFQMDDKALECPGFVAQVTGNADGLVESLQVIEDLIEDGHAVETEGPPGLSLNNPLQPPLVVNCPVPVTVE